MVCLSSTFPAILILDSGDPDMMLCLYSKNLYCRKGMPVFSYYKRAAISMQKALRGLMILPNRTYGNLETLIEP